MSEAIISVNNVKKAFRRDSDQELLVLNGVNLTLKVGEIVAVLGKSGSGKSTLLRILAGLVEPTGGEVIYRQQQLKGPAPGIAMVFQNFALMPWLTVLQNVELGLEAQRVGREERRVRAIKAIDIVGLDGFESAYPKELSGGMRQRVGFARALAVNPDILLMDEPFSALDVLTAENLRNDLLDLWVDKQTNTKSILIVTHNIEEAVLLADRIIIFDNSPGNIRADLQVSLEHPRDTSSPDFMKTVDEIYTLMTTDAKGDKPVEAAKAIDLGYRIPDAEVSELLGLLETMEDEYGTQVIDLPKLVDLLGLDIDDLFPLLEVLELLQFAKVSKGDVQLTSAGKAIVEADILARKKQFATHLIKAIPLVAHIRQVLHLRGDHTIGEDEILGELEDYLSDKEAERVLKRIIEWGRYAEIFAFDVHSGELSLENP